MAGLKAIGQTNGPSAFSLVADKLFVADSLVRFHLGNGAGRGRTIAKTFRAATVIVQAFFAQLESTSICTTGTLTWTAVPLGFESARFFFRRVFRPLRPTAIFLTVLFPAAIAFLAGLDYPIATKGLFGL